LVKVIPERSLGEVEIMYINNNNGSYISYWTYYIYIYIFFGNKCGQKRKIKTEPESFVIFHSSNH